MPSVSDTAYPRFKINPSAKELNELYTPTVYELAFARERAHQPLQRAGLLLLLKTFQRLGYFALCAEIPAPIIRHIFRCAGLAELPEQLLRAFGDSAFARCSQNPRANPKEKPLFALMQSRPDILGLFSINVVSFSIIVVLSALSFSANVVRDGRCFRVRAFYVLRPLHLAGEARQRHRCC